MAQTRAQSKLGRMAFAWVAVLGGFSGTPAEEMEGVRDKKAKAMVFPFGKHKDKQPAELSVEDLHRELAFWQKKVEEEKNPRYKANNERLVTAIQEAIAEKTAKPESPAAPSAQGKGESKVEGMADPASNLSPPAGDPSPLEQAQIRVRELCEAKGWTEAKRTVHCRKTWNRGFEELDLLAVQTLIQTLVGLPDAQRTLA